ncbi:polyketide synthase, partial [Corynespora cassiicola Philippines]
RHLLEVVYEGLKKSGITLKELSSNPVGCFVSSYACDYADIRARDPENRAPASTESIGRAMLSNRVTYEQNHSHSIP